MSATGFEYSKYLVTHIRNISISEKLVHQGINMELTMKKEVGLWIDHRKAVIVTIENEVEVIREIRSNIEKHVRFSSSPHSKAPRNPLGSTGEDVRDRQFGDHLGRYYDGVISFIRNADSIWIFGPGEAKVELENRLKHGELGEHIVGVEAVDKMTNKQIAAKVRDHFLV
jgi:hypothetical protein